MPRKGFSSYRNVHTRASTAGGEARFFPAEGAVRSSNDVKSMHVALDVYDLTADLLVTPAFQESDDPENWPNASTAVAIGSLTADADGITSSTGYDAVTLTKSFWRPGVLVRNKTTGARIEFALVAIRVDTRSC